MVVPYTIRFFNIEVLKHLLSFLGLLTLLCLAGCQSDKNRKGINNERIKARAFLNNRWPEQYYIDLVKNPEFNEKMAEQIRQANDHFLKELKNHGPISKEERKKKNTYRKYQIKEMLGVQKYLRYIEHEDNTRKKNRKFNLQNSNKLKNN